VGYKVLKWPSVGSGRQAGRSGDELSVSSLVSKSRFLVADCLVLSISILKNRF